MPLPRPAAPQLQLQLQVKDFVAVPVAVDAPPQERFAAEQLAHWLSRILPANISVLNVTAANASQPAHPHFVVGAGAAAAAALLPPSVAQQLAGRPEAFACRSSWGRNGTGSRNTPGPTTRHYDGPPTVVLTGGVAQPRGTLNAVFELLRDIGFRFWNAAHPNRTALITLPAATATVPACDRVFEPPIEYRLFNGETVAAGDPLWRVL